MLVAREVKSMDKKPTYAGSLSNSGAQVVNAPVKPVNKVPAGTVKRGGDLRSKK